MKTSTWKSIGAVFAGIVSIVVLSTGTDAALRASGVFPPSGERMSDALFLLATIYRTGYGVAGGYITARLAPNRPMQHALVLGAIGVALCIVGIMVTSGRGPELGPAWYSFALLVLAMPQTWAGGRLRGMQVRARADA